MAPEQRRRKESSRLFPLIGAVGAIVIAFLFYVSYSANDGLPLASSYEVKVELADAQRLAENNEVRVGGVRVGQVSGLDSEPGGQGRRPYAVVDLALDNDVKPLPVDTEVKVRPASVLGATYVDLVLGKSTDGVPDGGRLALARSTTTVELTDLLDIFDRSTAQGLQDTVGGLGIGFAGRGQAFNRSLRSFRTLLGPLTDVTRTLADPDTRLARFLRGYAATFAELGPVSDRVGGLVDGGATTFGALAGERAALGETIEAFPPAAETATVALRRLQPALDGLVVLAEELRPAAAELGGTLPIVNTTLRAGRAPLRALPGLSRRLRTTLNALDVLSRRTSARGALRKLRDLLRAAYPTIEVLEPLQTTCNYLPIWARSFASTFGDLGVGDGPAVVNIGVTHAGATGEGAQNATPSPDVGINYLSNADANECEAGNEPYEGKQLINNPPGFQSKVTQPSQQIPAVRERARSAGLVDPPAGAR